MQHDLFDDLPKQIKGDDGKVCNKCGEFLPLSSFGPHSGGNYLRPECKKCINRLRKVSSNLRKIHGDPHKDYKCPICNKKAEELSTYGNRSTPWVVDHCHKTDSFKGWLCNKCNMLLGGGEENIKILEKAIKYLKGVANGPKSKKPNHQD